jgi:hypothetical protein
MLHLGQLDAVAFAGKDGAQNTHSDHSGNVTDNAVDLDTHPGESLLHALHQAITILAQSYLARAGSCAPRIPGLRDETSSQHPEGVEFLQQLAVVDVSLCVPERSWHGLR